MNLHYVGENKSSFALKKEAKTAFNCEMELTISGDL